MDTTFVDFTSPQIASKDLILYKVVTKGGYSVTHPSERQQTKQINDLGRRLRYNPGTWKESPFNVSLGMFCWADIIHIKLRYKMKGLRVIMVLVPKGTCLCPPTAPQFWNIFAVERLYVMEKKLC